MEEPLARIEEVMMSDVFIDKLARSLVKVRDGSRPAKRTVQSLGSADFLVKPMLITNYVVALTREPVDTEASFVLVAQRIKPAKTNMPTPEEDVRKVERYSVLAYREHPTDITQSEAVELPDPVIIELQRQLGELKLEGMSFYHMAYLPVLELQQEHKR